MVVASALAVLAVAVGTSLAIATRPVAPQTGTATKPDTSTRSDSKASSSGSGTAAALEDGTHDAYITRIDRANDRIVVDVVQVFQGDRAVKEAIADGRPRSEAQDLTTWVRNQNPRLRTLPMASGVVVKLWGSCEESSKDRDAAFNALAQHARQKGTYYYTLTVAHGKVRRIQEQLAINAC
jgi:hypothetical protein